MSLLERFMTIDLFIKNKKLHISGIIGSGEGSLFTEKGFHDMDQFDIKNIIESVFKLLTPEQRKNILKTLRMENLE